MSNASHACVARLDLSGNKQQYEMLAHGPHVSYATGQLCMLAMLCKAQ